jgi:hypothetical protein
VILTEFSCKVALGKEPAAPDAHATCTDRSRRLRRPALATGLHNALSDYILVTKGNQPGLHAQLRKLPWKTVPAAAAGHSRGHGREEQRSLQAVTVPAGLAFPHAAQALRVTRRTRPLSGGKWRTITVYAITSLAFGQVTPQMNW